MAENSERKTPGIDSQESRREFVKKAGKLAIYTPPAVMLLLQPRTEAIAASAGVPGSTPSKRRKSNRFWLWRWLFGW